MSTGPKSFHGKSASSLNARRHGLTGVLDEAAVLSWYRVILENEAAVLDPFEQDAYLRAAAELARAEAHLQRVRAAEGDWMRGSEAPSTEKDLEHLRDRVLDELVETAFLSKRLKVAPEGRFLMQPFRRPADDEAFLDLLEEHAANPLTMMGWDRQGFGVLRRLDRAIDRDREKRRMTKERLGRTLARYRASAEARRRTALRRWIEQIAKGSQWPGCA